MFEIEQVASQLQKKSNKKENRKRKKNEINEGGYVGPRASSIPQAAMQLEQKY